jgi:ArsR family transcriptional regulator
MSCRGCASLRSTCLSTGRTDPHTVGVCVSHILARTGLAQSTVSAYMATLERAGLVRSTRVGRWSHYRRDEERIRRLVEDLGRGLGSALGA